MSFKHLKGNKFQYYLLLVIFILIMLRQLERIHYYVLYAEDGALFLSRSLTYGFNAVLMPYAGYFQVAPQLISLISYHFTLMYYPIVTLFICSLIYASAISQLISTSYSWINASPVVRFFLALSLTFIPGTPEILGNLANLHTVLFIFVTFRMIASFDEKYSVLDYILFILTAFSAGEFFLILPILLYRIFVIYTFKFKFENMIRHLLILFILIISMIVNYLTTLQSGVMGHKGLVDSIVLLYGYLPQLLLTISNRVFYLPILGNLTISFNRYFVTAIATGVVMICLTGFISIRNKMHDDRYFILLIIALISQILEIILIACVRSNAVHTPYIGQLINLNTLSVRYLIFMIPIALIFWQMFISKLLKKINLSSKRVNSILICISLYVIAINSGRMHFSNFYGLPHERLQEKYLWPYNARLIYNMIHDGKPETLIVPIAPPGWVLTISHPLK